MPERDERLSVRRVFDGPVLLFVRVIRKQLKGVGVFSVVMGIVHGGVKGRRGPWFPLGRNAERKEREGSMIKELLKCLCSRLGWSYGILWKYDKNMPILLLLDEAYHEECDASMIADIDLQVHIVGEGIIGRAAVEAKHCWMISDTSSETRQDHERKLETVAVIPVESRGVLQFGSSKEILEDTAFVDEARKLIQDTDNYGQAVSSEEAISCLLDETLNQCHLFAPKIPCQNSYSSDHSLIHDNSEDKPDPLTAGPMTSDFQTLYTDGHTSTKKQQEDYMFTVAPNSSDQSSSWSNELQNNPDALFLNLCLFDAKDRGSSIELEGYLDFESFDPTILDIWDIYEEESSTSWMSHKVKTDDCSSSLLSSVQVDTSKRLNPLPEEYIDGLNGIVFDSLSKELKYATGPSRETRNSALPSLLVKPQSSFTNTSDSFGAKKLFELPGSSHQLLNCCQNLVLDKSNHVGIEIDASKCILEEGKSTKLENFNTSPYEVSLEKLLYVQRSACWVMDTNRPDQPPFNKRIGLGTSCVRDNQISSSNHVGTMNSRQPLDHPRKASDLGFFKDSKQKTEMLPLVEDSCNIKNKSCLTKRKRTQESAKFNKKKVRHGRGSSRPRPKDRQLIQDRISELREVIPEAAKCSQVELLKKALDHLVFWQSVIFYVEKLRLVQEMSSEDHGFLLEMADFIRNLGLTILKGEMEVQLDKLGASFIVEARDTFMTSTDVSMALSGLLQNWAQRIADRDEPKELDMTEGDDRVNSHPDSSDLPPLWRASWCRVNQDRSEGFRDGYRHTEHDSLTCLDTKEPRRVRGEV
ncbi:Transcription factor LHW-like protein [Drosera capensis]